MSYANAFNILHFLLRLYHIPKRRKTPLTPTINPQRRNLKPSLTTLAKASKSCRVFAECDRSGNTHLNKPGQLPQYFSSQEVVMLYSLSLISVFYNHNLISAGENSIHN
ncbi:hypothetical protein [Trichormus variabilis]|uniref:hypothetical protein n=1 Tax=Anabaena variabilis TaxID=264691 RepID=UPI000F8F2423|nr:hypothetical protein [Trichormus variabilis]MBD2626203.1 hypothetical protein [Trichormus variabilis FACHB-164]